MPNISGNFIGTLKFIISNHFIKINFTNSNTIKVFWLFSRTYQKVIADEYLISKLAGNEETFFVMQAWLPVFG